jgi:transposase-like protein
VTLSLLAPQFQDADSARAYLENVRWPDGPVCPHCGSVEAYRLKAKEGSKTGARPGLCKCKACRKQFSVTVGTVFESSRIPLNKWLLAVYLLCSSKKGFSAHQLHRSVDVTYKTAWFMMHRIREAMKDGGPLVPMGGAGKVVEADETYWGNSRTKGIKKGRGGNHKEKVLALVERGGGVRSFHVASVTAATLRPILREQVSADTRLVTDEYGAYRGAHKEFAGHDTVNHGAKEYARYQPDGFVVTTNTIEGVFSLLKRGLNGVYHHVSPAHLHRYLVEFDFRYNARQIGDATRTDRALQGIGGKRLMYRES